jgi:hypothetical protein
LSFVGPKHNAYEVRDILYYWTLYMGNLGSMLFYTINEEKILKYSILWRGATMNAGKCSFLHYRSYKVLDPIK